jgi:hypothetical protein
MDGKRRHSPPPPAPRRGFFVAFEFLGGKRAGKKKKNEPAPARVPKRVVFLSLQPRKKKTPRKPTDGDYPRQKKKKREKGIEREGGASPPWPAVAMRIHLCHINFMTEMDQGEKTNGRVNTRRRTVG